MWNKIDVQHFTIKERQHAVWSKLSPLRRRSFNSLYTFNVLRAQKQYLFKTVLVAEKKSWSDKSILNLEHLLDFVLWIKALIKLIVFGVFGISGSTTCLSTCYIQLNLYFIQGGITYNCLFLQLQIFAMWFHCRRTCFYHLLPICVLVTKEKITETH